MRQKNRSFTVLYEQSDEGGFLARVPSLPGCMTQGETFEEAQRMVKDAIKAYCSSLKKHKEPIPQEGQEILGLVSIPLSA